MIRMTRYNPLVLSLSKDASGLEAWFDKLTTNGKRLGMLIVRNKPLALSLSKCVYRLEASLTCGRLRLDRLRTNGNSDKLTTNGNSVKFPAVGLSTSLETNGGI